MVSQFPGNNSEKQRGQKRQHEEAEEEEEEEANLPSILRASEHPLYFFLTCLTCCTDTSLDNIASAMRLRSQALFEQMQQQASGSATRSSKRLKAGMSK